MVQTTGLNRTWRPLGYWGLTINVTLGPVWMSVVPVIWPATNMTLLAQVYPTLLAAWVAAAAVRQWGKNTGVEQ